MRDSIHELFLSLRSSVADLRRDSPRTLALMAVCGLLVAIAPLALALSREEYTASSVIAQSVELPRYTQAEEVAGVKLIMGASIGSPDLQRAVAREVGWLDSPEEVATRATLTARWRRGRPEAVIAVRASSLSDARSLAEATTRAVSERAELVVRLGDAYRGTRASGGGAFDPPTPIRTGDERPLDAVLEALPGRLPPPPQPVWAAVAGLGLAGALSLAALALGPAAGRRRSDQPAP